MLLRYLLLNWLFSSDSVNERGRQFGLFLAVAFLTGCTTTVRTTNAIDFSQFHDKKAELTSKPADVEVAQQDPTELLNKADSYRKMGKMDDALYAYVQVLETQPENVAVLVAIADIHHGKSNYDLAEVAYRMALKSVPHNVDALEGLGLVLMHKHVYGEAEKTLKLAVQENSHRWRSHNALGLLADMDGENNKAREMFERAIYLSPTYHEKANQNLRRLNAGVN